MVPTLLTVGTIKGYYSGISFYTFQALSYVIDVYRGAFVPERDFSKLALYLAFFPQLVAGPIVRANAFLPQLREDRRPTRARLQTGIWVFVFGMFKKVVLADRLSIFVDDVFAAPAAFSTVTIWLAILSYSLQIYLDFSGYSDMAIGCACCMGYDLPRNFNLPYLSRNVTEFWRRWHISLSNWLRQYVYIPLGGNRRGNLYVNLMVTMLLGGLWHGASWTFVVWGAIHGVALCTHKVWLRCYGYRKSEARTVADVFYMLATFLFVSLCWVPFRAPSFEVASLVIGGAFLPREGIWQPYAWTIVACILVAIGSTWALVRSGESRNVEGFYYIGDLNKVGQLALLFFVAGLTLVLAYTGASPFVYFQF